MFWVKQDLALDFKTQELICVSTTQALPLVNQQPLSGFQSYYQVEEPGERALLLSRIYSKQKTRTEINPNKLQSTYFYLCHVGTPPFLHSLLILPTNAKTLYRLSSSCNPGLFVQVRKSILGKVINIQVMEQNRAQKHIYISLFMIYVAFQIKVEFIRSRLNDHLTPYTVNSEWIKDLYAHTQTYIQIYF